MNIEQRISVLEKKLKITEKNALQNYFELHPEKIKEFGFGDDYSWQDIANKIYRDNAIYDKYYAILVYLEEKYPNCFKNIYTYSSYTLERVLNAKDPLEFFKQAEKYTYEKNKKDFDDNFERFVKEPKLRQLKILDAKKSYYAENKFKQLARSYGVSVKDLAAGFREIFRMQSSSYQKLNPGTYALLKEITVIPSMLPKVIYRGFFMDGNKIKNKEKFLKQWSIGNEPKVKLGKPTSWSISKAVATSFMTDQDRVKDKENGYHILIKITNPKEDEVIADFRNFEFSGFWNQQEILVAPDVTRYTVEEIIPYQEYSAPNNQYRNFGSRNSKPGAGSFGSTKNELLLDIFNLSKYDISLDTKIDYKGIKDLTIGELVERKMIRSDFFSEDYKPKVYKVLLPIYKLYKQLTWAESISQVFSPTKVIVNARVKMSDLRWALPREDTKALAEMGLFDNTRYANNDAVFSLDTKIELLQNSINRFVFNVKFDDFKLVSSKLQDGEKILDYMNQEDSVFKIKLLSNINQIEKIYPTVRINLK